MAAQVEIQPRMLGVPTVENAQHPTAGDLRRVHQYTTGLQYLHCKFLLLHVVSALTQACGLD